MTPWTHRVTTEGGAFWCYATSLTQGLKIAGGDPARVQALGTPIPNNQSERDQQPK